MLVILWRVLRCLNVKKFASGEWKDGRIGPRGFMLVSALDDMILTETREFHGRS